MKIGVVGFGSIGSRHAANAMTLGHDVRCYDPHVGFWEEREIYDWCDAVVIASPTEFHAEAMWKAVRLGKHMLVEKPIARSDRELQKLLMLAASNQIVIMMGNNLRFHPCVQQAKTWIDGGEIGVPIWAHFTCATQSVKPLYFSDGVILNTGSHEVDMAMHLLGPARVVNANARIGLRPGTGDSDVNVMLSNSDEIADFLLEHENGCRSSFHLDFVTQREIREFMIVGNKEQIGVELPSRRFWSKGEWCPALLGGTYDDDYVSEMCAFVDRIEGKDVPGATGQDGLAVLDILLDVRSKAGVAPR